MSGFLAALEGRWRPILLTAVFTGLRASELRGLRWEDVDLVKGELHVRQRADRYNQMGRPKSEAGERTVPLTPSVVNMLREHKLASPTKDGLVFPSATGNVLSLVNVVEFGLKPAMIRRPDQAHARRRGSPDRQGWSAGLASQVHRLACAAALLCVVVHQSRRRRRPRPAADSRAKAARAFERS